MDVELNLTFRGQCEEAFRLYEECLGGQLVQTLTWGDSPLAASQPAMRDQLIHATLQLHGQTLSGTDAPTASFKPAQGFAIQLNLNDRAEAERIYATLSAGGVILVPLGRSFFAELYAVFTDRFGIPWKINCTHDPA